MFSWKLLGSKKHLQVNKLAELQCIKLHNFYAIFCLKLISQRDYIFYEILRYMHTYHILCSV